MNKKSLIFTGVLIGVGLSLCYLKFGKEKDIKVDKNKHKIIPVNISYKYSENEDKKKTCNSCGNSVMLGNNFCHNCGSKDII